MHGLALAGEDDTKVVAGCWGL